ncbi:insulin receptor-like [Stegodyphus dumicola]|uniref:insulin receptor-like n=1 Tax=Stegodyphus dumicola TaxID=202533 RepID=UPI0015B11944|nr:insulin receptor-like [Stegodyphus dumicola]
MTAVNGYVWFLPLWFTSNWYDTDGLNNPENDDLGKVTCSTEQMVEAINGHMSLAYKYYADDDDVMQEGKTVREWLDRYKKMVDEQGLEVSRYGGYTYDAVWVYAMALDALLKENNSHVATLHSSRTSKRLLELLHKTNFSGVSGSLYFLNSSRISDIIIWQWLNHSVRQIGVYHPSSQSDGVLELNEKSIVWLTPNGKKPEDGSQEYSYCAVEPVRKLFRISCEVAIIIVNVFGLTIFGVLVVAAAFWYKHRYESRMKLTEARMKELGLITNRVPFALDEWEIPRDHIVINRKLGEGAFGTVFGGEAYVPNEGWKAVAVKTLKTGAKVEEKLDFLSEAEVMKQFDHINVVKLIGVCTMGEPVYTVMEFMLYGDLKTYLLSRRNLVSEADRGNSDEVSDRRLTNMALDIARGLSYLANLKYVHRDLACRNCLVNMHRSVKIADFGMCRPMFDSDYYRYNKKGMLPIRWMAPESLTDGLFTPMSDVWSYGVVLYEIITFASFPYQGLTNDQVLQHVKDHNTLPVPKGCKPELSNLLLQCWARSPHQRPQAAAIVEILARNPELISPSLDVPTASVEVEDTGTFELTIHDRSRVHSFSSVWQNRKTSIPFDRMQTELSDSSRTTLCAGENSSHRKHSGGKFSNKKTTLHESFKKVKRDIYKDRGIELLPQITYL